MNNQDDDKLLLGRKNRIIHQKPVGFSVSHGRKKHSGSLNAKMLINAARNYPEVMVKIPKRHGSSNGLKGIQNNLDYISRNGNLELENQDGVAILGKDAIGDLMSEYQAIGIPNDSKRREALNVVLSMPPGTNPEKLKNAVRAFAQETFCDNHWVMVLHTDTDHPHCHLNILLKNQNGKRINTSPYELNQWRERFAEKMMEEGVLCTATKRKQRGKFTKAQNNTVRHIKQRGIKPYIHKQQVSEIVNALAEHKRPTHPYLHELLESKNILEEQYAVLSRMLYQAGHKNEAKMVADLRALLAQADTRSATQKQFDAVNQATAKAKPIWLDTQPEKENKQTKKHSGSLKTKF